MFTMIATRLLAAAIGVLVGSIVTSSIASIAIGIVVYEIANRLLFTLVVLNLDDDSEDDF